MAANARGPTPPKGDFQRCDSIHVCRTSEAYSRRLVAVADPELRRHTSRRT